MKERIKSLWSAVYERYLAPEIWQQRRPFAFGVWLVLLDILFTCSATVLGAYLLNNPEYLFREGKPITIISTVQLLVVAHLAWLTYRVRFGPGKFKWSTTSIWAVIALGFFLLALDEIGRGHETIDHTIHKIFHIKETPFTDRFDDYIVGVYGLVALGILYRFRRELNHFRAAIPYFVSGFLTLGIMVFLDAFTNGEDVARVFWVDPAQEKFWYEAICLMEETSKLIGEAIFIAALHASYLRALVLGQASAENSRTEPPPMQIAGNG